MPVGLIDHLKGDEVASLIGYLTASKHPPKTK